MEVELRIAMEADECRNFCQVLSPDNDDSIEMKCIDTGISILISSLKATSLYNIVDDFLRSYEVFKKIRG